MLERGHPRRQHSEVETFLIAQAQRHAHHRANAVGRQRAQQYDVLTQGANRERQHDRQRQRSHRKCRSAPEEAEGHQPQHHSTTDRRTGLKEHRHHTLDSNPLKAHHAEQQHRQQHRPDKCPVIYPIPVATGDDRKDDSAP
ncbi:hypothetical protein D3C81_291740 [compost metagenome]